MKHEKESINSLTKQMEMIAKTYFEARNQCTKTYLLSDSDIYDLKHHQTRFIEKVESTFEKLNPIEQLFINNDFFYEAYPFWWEEIYSKRRYLQFKKRAILHFLKEFFNEL